MKVSKVSPPVQWSTASKIIGFLHGNEAARVVVKSLQNTPDVVDTDILQCPLVRTGDTFAITPSDHFQVVVFQRKDKMPSLDTPAPPLRSLSMHSARGVEVTDHVLPDFVEVLKKILGKKL